jgi:hydrogenase-4 component B
MSRLGGLWRAMPWTATLFTLGATAIAGLPPLNGFVSEWLVYLGLFDAVSARGPAAFAAIPAVVLLAMTGALALACFAKVCGIVFLGFPRRQTVDDVHECGWAMRLPMLVLGLACAVLGLAPVLFWPVIAKAAAVWQPAWTAVEPPAPLVTLGAIQLALAALAVLAAVLLWRRAAHNAVSRAGTWDCGYAAPTPRMQYTAGSFAGIITGWFRWILRPQQHRDWSGEIFPTEAHFEEHTPETVLEQVVEPVGSLVMRTSAAARRLQHGRVQAYILYLLIGLAGLALLAVMGGFK